MANYYPWFKAAHTISIICWMAAIFYLPRLYSYHTKAIVGSEMDKTFQIMEHRLIKIIMNPAMILSLLFGLTTAYLYGFKALGLWFHIKMSAVLVIVIYHALLIRWSKDFAAGKNKHSEKFYRISNEVPPIMMIIAVIMVIVKPFE